MKKARKARKALNVCENLGQRCARATPEPKVWETDPSTGRKVLMISRLVQADPWEFDFCADPKYDVYIDGCRSFLVQFCRPDPDRGLPWVNYPDHPFFHDEGRGMYSWQFDQWCAWWNGWDGRGPLPPAEKATLSPGTWERCPYSGRLTRVAP